MHPSDEAINEEVIYLRKITEDTAADMLLALKVRAETAEKERDYWKEEWRQIALEGIFEE
mgnify:CR=1 FL=1